MVAEHLQRTPLPAVPLVAKVAQRLWRLRPADGVRLEDDSIAPLLIGSPAMQPGDDLHVLANRVVAESTDTHHSLALKDAERARDDEQGVHRRLRDTADQECAEVLDDLKGSEPVAWHAHPGLPRSIPWSWLA